MKKDIALVEIKELVIVNQNFLSTEGRITHGLRMDIDKWTSFHIKVGTGIKSVISQNEIIHRGKEEEVVECLLMETCKQSIFYYEIALGIRFVIGKAIPSEIIPDTILIVSQIKV